MNYKSELVFVRILVPLLIGIYVAYVFQRPSFISFFLLITIALFCSLLIINVCYKNLKAYNFKEITGPLCFACWCSFGSLICLINIQLFGTAYYAKKSPTCLKIWISNEPQLNHGILRFEASVITAFTPHKPEKATGKLLISLKLDSSNPLKLNYGDELIIIARYSPIEPVYNPAEFDFKAWLATKNIYHQAFIDQDQLILLNTHQGNPIIKYALAVRKRQVEIYRQLIHNDEAFAVASTLVLGYRADLSKETLSAYSKTGTIHALSVSGMHVGIIYIFLNWALFFLNSNTVLKIIKLFVISALIWYYSLLTGFSPSVLRSAVMLTVYILAKSFNRTSNSYNILAFTAFCLLVYNPFLAWDVGFQLSFLAVFGLIYLQPKIYHWFYFKNKVMDKLWATIALSLAAQLTTFPLSIYYFHQFPLYFIFSNLFILLPLTAMMYLGIGILLLRLYFLAPIFEWIITFTNKGLKWIANLPFSGIDTIWIDKWQLVLLSLFLVTLVLALINYKKRFLITAIIILTVYQAYAGYHKIIMFNQRKIICFSLQKNYAVAFIDGLHSILVTDLRDTDKNYEFFVKPALDQLQIRKIEFIDWKTDTMSKSFIKTEHQICFYKVQILLLDQSFNYKKIAMRPKFNLVWLHQNPRQHIKELKEQLLFPTLLIDAASKDYRITKYEDEANKIGLKYYTLKKNKAYLVDLN